jgi:hypothetical protein
MNCHLKAAEKEKASVGMNWAEFAQNCRLGHSRALFSHWPTLWQRFGGDLAGGRKGGERNWDTEILGYWILRYGCHKADGN